MFRPFIQWSPDICPYGAICHLFRFNLLSSRCVSLRFALNAARSSAVSKLSNFAWLRCILLVFADLALCDW